MKLKELKERNDMRPFCVIMITFTDNDNNLNFFSDSYDSPGLEFRINSKGFRYVSLLASPIINNEIRRFRLQPLKQCFQKVTNLITCKNGNFFFH